MNNIFRNRSRQNLLLFTLIVGLVYLPTALRLTYYRDDWYYVYDSLVGPTGIFRALFAIDRPARGLFYEIYFALFGMTPIAYHLGMFLWRLVGGLVVVWLFYLLWPRQRQAGWLAGMLFAIYPGFTWWVSGIEYQPMAASAALMVLSLALTVLGVKSSSRTSKGISIICAILTGWIYLSLVEYAAGMEVFRFVLVYAVVVSDGTGRFWSNIKLAIEKWWINLIIPAGFAFWRFVLFTSERRATDLGSQLSVLFADPVRTSLHWFLNFLVSIINVALSAWIKSLTDNFFSGELGVMSIGLLIALIASSLGWLALSSLKENDSQAEDETWQIRSVQVGIAGLVLGILPVIAANRQITFPSFSHYALPASLGLVFLVAGLLLIPVQKIRPAIWITLLGLSALTHQGLGTSALQEEQSIADVWRQIAWRAPSLKQGVTLMTYYPDINYGVDTDVVWGPANYVYYPAPQEQIPVRVPIAALTVEDQDINKVLAGANEQEFLYRAHTMTVSYENILVISQPSRGSCVHILDAHWPEISTNDVPVLRLLAPLSRIENIDLESAPVNLPASIFGREREHNWCYFYQQAELARQRGDWNAVAQLGDKAQAAGYHPNDQIEWMPFLQAYAVLDQQVKVKEIAPKINSEKFYKEQACENLHVLSKEGYPLSSEMQTFAEDLFCIKK